MNSAYVFCKMKHDIGNITVAWVLFAELSMNLGAVHSLFKELCMRDTLVYLQYMTVVARTKYFFSAVD